MDAADQAFQRLQIAHVLPGRRRMCTSWRATSRLDRPSTHCLACLFIAGDARLQLSTGQPAQASGTLIWRSDAFAPRGISGLVARKKDLRGRGCFRIHTLLKIADEFHGVESRRRLRSPTSCSARASMSTCKENHLWKFRHRLSALARDKHRGTIRSAYARRRSGPSMSECGCADPAMSLRSSGLPDRVTPLPRGRARAAQ